MKKEISNQKKKTNLKEFQDLKYDCMNKLMENIKLLNKEKIDAKILHRKKRVGD